MRLGPKQRGFQPFFNSTRFLENKAMQREPQNIDLVLRLGRRLCRPSSGPSSYF